MAKPKLNTVSAAAPKAPKFALGTRPESLRDNPVKRVSVPKAPNTRDYGKPEPAPSAAIQPPGIWGNG